MDSGQLGVSVVIPAHRRPQLLRRCLDLVCESFSVQLPLRYIYQPEANLGLARNNGFRATTGDLVVFLDDDTKVSSGFIVGYERAYRRFAESRFYGGPLVADYEERPEEWLAAALPPSARGFSLADDASAITEPLFLGGNIALGRKAFDLIGGFDTLSQCGASNSGLLGEETRAQATLIRAGILGCFVPEASVFHWVPRDRCSKEWLTRRRFRSGQTDAALAEASRTLVRPFPLWMVRSWASSSLKRVWRRARRQHPSTYLQAELQTAYIAGYITASLSSLTGRKASQELAP